MYLQTRSEFARARLISDSPLSFELAFDPTGHSSFPASHALRVQLATRHIVSDICELRQGVQSPWQITQQPEGILLEIDTYGWFKERLELKANPERAAIDVSYRLEFMKPFEAHEMGTLLLRPAEDPRLPVVYLAGRQGVCPLQETVSREVLVDSQAPLAGWLLCCPCPSLAVPPVRSCTRSSHCDFCNRSPGVRASQMEERGHKSTCLQSGNEAL